MLLTTNDKLLRRVKESYNKGRRGDDSVTPHLAIDPDGIVLTHDGRHRACKALQEGLMLEVDLRYYQGKLDREEQHRRLLIEDMPTEHCWFGEPIEPFEVSSLTSQYRDLTISLEDLDKIHGV